MILHTHSHTHTHIYTHHAYYDSEWEEEEAEPPIIILIPTPSPRKVNQTESQSVWKLRCRWFRELWSWSQDCRQFVCRAQSLGLCFRYLTGSSGFLVMLGWRGWRGAAVDASAFSWLRVSDLPTTLMFTLISNLAANTHRHSHQDYSNNNKRDNYNNNYRGTHTHRHRHRNRHSWHPTNVDHLMAYLFPGLHFSFHLAISFSAYAAALFPFRVCVR